MFSKLSKIYIIYRRGEMVEFPATGDIGRYNSTDEDNFTQAGVFWRNVLNDDEKERLVDNISAHLCNAQKFIQVI